jgi:hypothetical protein
VALFGRRRGRRKDDEEYAEYNESGGYDRYDDYSGDGHGDRSGYADHGRHDDRAEFSGTLDLDETPDGPFDEAEAPEDGRGRLDLGSVLLPIPDGAQLQVEMDPSGPVKAVHVITPDGQLTVNGYAAPRSGGLWNEISNELAEQLRKDGARVTRIDGMWGTELAAWINDVVLRFVGVDGPRWMLRAVVVSPVDRGDAGVALLRDVVLGTVVVRGDQPMPVRTPLPIELPPAIAQHIADNQQ